MATTVDKAQKAKGINGSTRADLKFSVSRVRAGMKAHGDVKRVSAVAPVFLAAVLEYLTAEIVDLSAVVTVANGKKTINPRAIQLAIRNDDELSNLLGTMEISTGGVMPNINPQLLPPARKGSKTVTA